MAESLVDLAHGCRFTDEFTIGAQRGLQLLTQHVRLTGKPYLLESLFKYITQLLELGFIAFGIDLFSEVEKGVTTGLASPSFPYFAVEPLVFLRHVEVPEGIPLAIEVGGS